MLGTVFIKKGDEPLVYVVEAVVHQHDTCECRHYFVEEVEVGVAKRIRQKEGLVKFNMSELLDEEKYIKCAMTIDKFATIVEVDCEDCWIKVDKQSGYPCFVTRFNVTWSSDEPEKPWCYNGTKGKTYGEAIEQHYQEAVKRMKNMMYYVTA